jgi:hypothetical protein
MAPCGVPSGEAEEMQRARNEEREDALACVERSESRQPKWLPR